MFGRKVWRQSPQQSSASHDPFKRQEGIFQVQLQAEIGRQDKPARHLFLLAGRGHLLGQRLQHLLFEAQLKELFLIGLANDFDLKEFFELCFKEKMLEALAEEMPTPR